MTPATSYQLPATNRVYLMILDGFGEGSAYPGNAELKARMPKLQALRQKYPWTLLKTSGEAVGLPEGTQGGSEVGHFTMGMGRVIFQSLEEINRSIRNRSFFEKKPFLEAIEKIKQSGGALHLLGMISDQGVHSHLHHLFALMELAHEHRVPTFIHAITDGRDVPERTASGFLTAILDKIKELNTDHIRLATIVGRYFAMDRDNNWDRTAKAYNLLVKGEGIRETDPLAAIEHSYARGIATDYYIEPILLEEQGLIHDHDAVIFWNYRTDRTRQLTHAFTGETEPGFQPEQVVRPFFVCFGDYSKKAPVVFPTVKVEDNLGSVIERHGLLQLRVAETEKYAHVTYFFNSQVETPFPHEKRILVDSPKVPSYADKPEMSAREITSTVLKEIEKQEYHLIVQNFANPDLVGHSGNLESTIKACEVIDECIGAIAEACLKNGYTFMLTADHGNAERMLYENGEPCPSHTLNPVIFLLASPAYEHAQLSPGSLEDVAPTILEIMNIEKPAAMTGRSLFI